MSQSPKVISADGTRHFACFPVALVIFIVNEDEKMLLLSSPPKRKREDTWEPPSGALEEGETVLAGALRETREELGRDVRIRPLGTVHAHNFHYDDDVRYMISLCYLMAYEGGRIVPGDDMAGSLYRWWSLDELERDNIAILQAPVNRRWLLTRVIELYRLWKTQDIGLDRLGLHAMD